MGYWTGKTVVVLGGTGFLGTRLTHLLKKTDAHLVVPAGTSHLDLRKPDAFKFFCLEYALQPDIVFHLAANVGGIGATSRWPVEFLYDNVMMGLNVVRECYELDVSKLVVAGSVCSYPERAPIPMLEDNLWEGYPEKTNGAYGSAKRTVLVAQQAYKEEYDFLSVHVLMANLYGEGQTFDVNRSHVIPAIINKIKVAMDLGLDEVKLWGTGNATRDFLYVGDAAKAFIEIAEKYYSTKPINIGSGEEIGIAGLAHLIAELMGYHGAFHWDGSKPDGQPRRCLRLWRVNDSTGWKPAVRLREGLQRTIDWYYTHLRP